MPPSPALRCSPGRELRGEKHKRGHSFENGLLFTEKDDDLALFNEMKSRERESFLLQSSDNFEDAFSSKLKYFSNFTIPVRGESSELLNAEGDKNDYDWLLTPPDTPLFRSLDDDPPQVTAGHRGRPRSQPISLSRTSTMDKSHRSSRGSPSPNRSSPSPRSGNSSQQLRGRPSLARHASPTPSLCPTSPNKPSKPASRSSTPASQRMSPGSSKTSPGIRGTSPVKTSRGNSASPKIRSWQSNIHGFSLDAPPNLRTSLADRPASYVRGSSPASRNGKDSASRHSRQSMSPTASRSVSSSHSHDQDRFSSHSKGSVASSGDDDLDSLQSAPLGGSDHLVSKRTSPFSNNNAPRSLRLLSASSAPKRSFDSALRQMDHRKNHQNMFRPLISSVPSTSFYIGKDSSYNHIIARRSSITASSNASSDQGSGFIPDSKVSDSLQVSLAENEKLPYPEDREEIFAFDKVDTLSEGNRDDSHNIPLNKQLGDFIQDNSVECDPGASEDVRHYVVDTEISSTSDHLHVMGDFSEVGALENMEVCSRCGCQYRAVKPIEDEISLCPDCRERHVLVNITVLETTTEVTESSPELSVKNLEESKTFGDMNSVISMPELLQQPTDKFEAGPIQNEEYIKQGQSSYSEQGQDYLQENAIAGSLAGVDEQRLTHQHDIKQPFTGHSLPDTDARDIELQLYNDHQDLKIDSSEGGGIAMLLKRSSSIKGPVVQGRNFTATIKTYENFSYARESTNSLRSSTGHGSASASSSVDYGSAKHKETHVQCQLSAKTFDTESYRFDMSSKSPSSLSSLSGVSSHAHQALGVAAVTPEDNIELSANISCCDEGTPHGSHLEMLVLENKEDDVSDTSFVNLRAPQENTGSTNISTSKLSSNVVSIPSEDNSASLQNDENCGSYENRNYLPNHARSTTELEPSPITTECPLEEEHAVLHTSVDQDKDATEIPSHSSLVTQSEIETESCEHEIPGLQVDGESPKSMCNINEFQEQPDPCSSDYDMTTSSVEPNPSSHVHGILDKSIVLVKCDEGREAKSLTLEEATDTILYCSSIVHELAYQAASIAIEKSNEVPLEDSRPTVTILGKSNAGKKDPPGRTKTKHTSKSVKAKQRQAETDAKASVRAEKDESAGESMLGNVGIHNNNTGESFKPPKLESKCNCSIM